MLPLSVQKFAGNGDPDPIDLIIAELLVRFFRHAETYYVDSSKEYEHFEKTAIPLTDTYSHKPANDFGPAELKVVRQHVIDHHAWSRKVVNRRVNRVRQIWKWAVEEGLVRPLKTRLCSRSPTAIFLPHSQSGVGMARDIGPTCRPHRSKDEGSPRMAFPGHNSSLRRFLCTP